MKNSNCSKNSSSKPSEQINNPTLAEVLLALNQNTTGTCYCYSCYSCYSWEGAPSATASNQVIEASNKRVPLRVPKLGHKAGRPH